MHFLRHSYGASTGGLFLRFDGTLRPSWKVGLFLVVHGALQGVSRNLRSGFTGGLADLWISAGVVLMVSWGFLRLEGLPLSSIGLNVGRRWGTHCLAGAAGGFLLVVAVAVVIYGLDGFHWEWSRRPDSWSFLADGAWLFLAVGVREEVLFRGYAFQRAVDGIGRGASLVLASLYFAYAHGENPGLIGASRIWASLNLGLAGTLLGLCYLKTRSLALPIGLHLGWNWTQGSLLGFRVSGVRVDSLLEPVLHDHPLWLTGGAFGLEATLPCTIVLALPIAVAVFWKPPHDSEVGG